MLSAEVIESRKGFASDNDARIGTPATADSEISDNTAMKSILIFMGNVCDHRPRTAGAPDAGSEATMHPAWQRVGVRWIAPLAFMFSVVAVHRKASVCIVER